MRRRATREARELVSLTAHPEGEWTRHVRRTWVLGRVSLFWMRRWLRPSFRRIGPYPGFSLRGAFQVGPIVGMVWAKKEEEEEDLDG